MILFKSQARFAVMLSFVEENGGAKRAGGARSGEPAGRRVLLGRSRPRAHSNLNDGEIEPAPRAAGTGRRVRLVHRAAGPEGSHQWHRGQGSQDTNTVGRPLESTGRLGKCRRHDGFRPPRRSASGKERGHQHLNTPDGRLSRQQAPAALSPGAALPGSMAPGLSEP